MYSLLPLALTPMSLPAAVTDSAICLRDGLTRIVELRVEGPTGVPCSVDYIKPDEGKSEQRLWLARNDASYCVAQFESFLLRMENKLNWSCEKRVATLAQTASEKEEILSAASPADGAVDTSDLPAASFDTLREMTDSATVEYSAVPSSDAAPTAASNEEIATIQPVESSLAAAQTLQEPRDQGNINLQYEAAGGLDLAAIRSAIPTGFYSADPSNPHSGAAQQCPDDGYFIWNIRDQQRPVFEMGPVLEFAVRVSAVSSIADIRADAADPNSNMALRPLNSASNNGSVQSGGVELVINGADSDNSEQQSAAVCRYVRG